MTVLEGVSLSLVLLLALYGCAKATVGIVQRILIPREHCVSLHVTLRNDDNAELQIRFAKWLASEWSVPVLVDTSACDDERKRIVSTLMRDKAGEKSCEDPCARV